MKIRRQKKKTQKIKILNQNYLFLDTYFFKICTFTFGAWSFLLVHIWLTPSEGPKGFVIDFLRNQTMEKGHLPWSMV